MYSSRVVDVRSLAAIVRVNLTMARTVFVTPAHALDSDWKNYFVPVMRREGLKYARHLDMNDKTLLRTYWYGYTRGLHA